MRKIVIVAGLIASASQAAPKHGPWEDYKPKPGPVLIVGYSTESCEAVVNGQNETQQTVSKFFAWGIWSGLNMGKGAIVGTSTDAIGIWGEVKLECANHPSETLFAATTAVYWRLKAREGK